MRRVGAVLALLLIVTACGTGAAKTLGPRAAPSLSTLQKHPVFRRNPKGPLAAGRYYPKFYAPLSFAVPKGWTSLVQAFPDTLALYPTASHNGDELDIFRAAFEFRGTCLHSPKDPDIVLYTEKVIPAPADVVGYLRRFPYLKNQHVASVTVAGRPATQIDAVVKGIPKNCIRNPQFRGAAGLFKTPGTERPGAARPQNADLGPYTVVSGQRIRIVTLTVAKFPLVISIEGPPAGFNAFEAAAEKIVDSVTVG